MAVPSPSFNYKNMRFIFLFLLALLAFFNYELWYGNNGQARISDLQEKIENQQKLNDAAIARNNAMAAEVQDLRDGGKAVEEIGRLEQGMIKQDEIFVQILTPNS